jgi:alkylation response protein AidB-like acyl-CoA dehydrogenase
LDFELSEAQHVIAAAAADVLAKDGGLVASGLVASGLLALTLPEWLGGDGLGVVEAGVLLTEVGRRAADVPALATTMLGVLPVVRWGSRDLQELLLAGVGSGEATLTAGIRGHASADNGTVTGTLVGVPYAADATWMLVPVGEDVVVVPAGEVTMTRTPASWPEYTVRLDRTPGAGILAGAAADLYQLAAAGAAAVADGVVAGALELTAKYIASREQFGRPLATFQAVAQQIADVYIISRTLHLAALSAGWRLSVRGDAGQDCEVAAYWLAAEAPAALRTCHHLHGGLGMDISYPLHRYSSMISDLARFVGGAEYRLERLAPCSST